MRRQEALREILAQAQCVRRKSSIETGLPHVESEEPFHGDEMDAANWHNEAATNDRVGEIRWPSQGVLDHAVRRFSLGLYGTCDACGEEIPVERLRIVPFAAYCVDCQQEREDGGIGQPKFRRSL